MTAEGRAAVMANVASEMARREWNVSDLARAAKIDVGTAGDFLNGTRWPQRSTQSKIEVAFDWTAGSIRRWELELAPNEAEPKQDPETVRPLDQDAGVLLSLPPGAFDGLTPADREEAIAAAKAALLERAREIKRRIDS